MLTYRTARILAEKNFDSKIIKEICIVEKHIPVVVLTGGPCAGKTTGLCYLQEKLANLGFHVFTVPEAPTLLMSGGITPKENVLSLPDFQKSVFRLMRIMEDEFKQAAQGTSSGKSIIICDRGLMDTKAYAPDGLFETIASGESMSVTELRDGRYDAVFHLRTAALGAEEYYTLANNVARFESVEEARIVDEKTLQAWVGHPHLKIIDNATDFEGKMKRLLQGLCRVLGIPVPLEIERKFLIDPIDLEKMNILHQAIEIEQVYLISRNPDEEIRVRKRGQNGTFVYYQTMKRALRPSVRVEVEHRISEAEYEWSLRYRLPDTAMLRKRRFCFTFDNQYFELDVLEEPRKGLYLLEIELTEENERITIPPFINVVKEVTNDSSFSNCSLASHPLKR
ncbi:MAG: hypothetical protein BMS9Abin13_143 [Patescibacteria group bacterium]|nr:MAG: hypothetical protein BMS9Abin13_143 [Patescibacteria group bacterium]